MSHRLTGWLFVATQAVLLGLVVLLPSGNTGPVPSWLRATTTAAIIAGLGLVALAAMQLGSSLTPTPVPRDRSQLTTTGLFRYARHPIYSGVLLIVSGIALASGSAPTAAIAAVTVLFFVVKAQWEEQRLRDHYTDYAAYAAATGRFCPRLRSR